MENMYDVIIVGGGIAGYTAALALKNYNLKVMLVEERDLGGCCLNRGCIPMKSFIETTSKVHELTLRKWKGLDVSGLTFHWEIFQKDCQEMIEGMQNQILTLLYMAKVDYCSSFVKSIKKRSCYEVELSSLEQGKRMLMANNVIIATGSKPRLWQGVKDSGKIISVDDFWALEKMPGSVVIVGAGSSGCELAYSLCCLGVDVAVVEKKDEILDGFDAKNAKFIRKKFLKMGIRFFLRQNILSIDEQDDFIQCELSNGTALSSDVIVTAMGRVPALKQSMVAELGLLFDQQGFVLADESGCTLIKGLYCIGDANGQNMLAHYAQMQAMAVAAKITDTGFSKGYIPKCIYIKPQLACIGKSMLEIQRENTNVSVGTCRYDRLGMAQALKCASGKIMVFRDTGTDQIVGAQIIGEDACEIIHILQAYMEEHVPCKKIVQYVFAHPTLSEGIKQAIMDSYEGGR